MNQESRYVLISENISQALLPTLNTLSREGITYLAYGIKRKNIRTCFFSHTQWGKTFINQKLYTSDPYIYRAEHTNNKFIFWEDVEFSNIEKKIDDWRREECKITNGMTFSIHAYDFHELIAIGTSSPLMSMKALAFEEKRSNHLFQLLSPLRNAHFKHLYTGNNHEK